MKVTGSNITITDSVVNKMNIVPLGNCEQDTLPSEYQAVEYIESNGTQYIDTNFKANQGTGTFTKGNDVSIPNPDNPIDIKVVTGDNQVVVCNKNLIDYKMISINASLEDNGYYRVSFPSGTIILSNIFKTNQQYTLSFNGYGESELNNGRFIINYTDGTSQNVIVAGTTPTDYLFTSTAGKTIDNIKSSWGSSQITYLKDLMLELGTTATTYVAHQEQSYTLHLGNEYLAGIPNTDYKDEIDVVNKKIIRKVGKVVLDGTETYGILGGYDLYCIKSLNNYFNTNENTVISNMLQPSNNAEIWSKRNQTGNNLIAASSDGFRIMMNDYNDGEVLKAEILRLYNANTPLYAYYRLATPTEETITDTSLINELNELQELLSYDGTTNITVISSSENAQMSVEVTYTSKSDMNEKLTNIFNSIKSKLYHIIRAL